MHEQNFVRRPFGAEVWLVFFSSLDFICIGSGFVFILCPHAGRAGAFFRKKYRKIVTKWSSSWITSSLKILQYGSPFLLEQNFVRRPFGAEVWLVVCFSLLLGIFYSVCFL